MTTRPPPPLTYSSSAARATGPGSRGGGFYIHGGSLAATNCTFAANKVSLQGGHAQRPGESFFNLGGELFLAGPLDYGAQENIAVSRIGEFFPGLVDEGGFPEGVEGEHDTLKGMGNIVLAPGVNHLPVGVMHDAALVAEQVPGGDESLLVGEFRGIASHVPAEVKEVLFVELQGGYGGQAFR